MSNIKAEWIEPNEETCDHCHGKITLGQAMDREWYYTCPCGACDAAVRDLVDIFDDDDEFETSIFG